MAVKELKNSAGKKIGYEAYYSWKDPVTGGRDQTRKRFKTKYEAEQYIAGKREKIRNLRFHAKNGTLSQCLPKPSLLEVIEEYKQAELPTKAQSTQRNELNRLKILCRDKLFQKQIDQITTMEIRDLIDKVCVGKTNNTKGNYRKVIKVMFNFAISNSYLQFNPCDQIKYKSDPEPELHVLDEDEFKLLIQTARRTGNENYPLWLTAGLTGCRSAELQALKVMDVDFKQDTLIIRRVRERDGSMRPFPKTKRWRKVPLNKTLRELFKTLIEQKNLEPDDFLLPRVTTWVQGDAAKVLRTFLNGLGITKPVRFHDFRAYFCTQMMLKGVHPQIVKEISGHKSDRVFQRYVRYTAKNTVGSTEALNLDFSDEPCNIGVPNQQSNAI